MTDKNGDKIPVERRVAWKGPLVLGPFQPGDHLLWVTETVRGLDVDFVQIIPSPVGRVNIWKDAKPITYRIADFSSLFLAKKSQTDFELYSWAYVTMWQYLHRFYGNSLVCEWYLCDDSELIARATYHEWEKFKKDQQQPIDHSSRGGYRLLSKEDKECIACWTKEPEQARLAQGALARQLGISPSGLSIYLKRAGLRG
jgi:hypothetical protein